MRQRNNRLGNKVVYHQGQLIDSGCKTNETTKSKFIHRTVNCLVSYVAQVEKPMGLSRSLKIMAKLRDSIAKRMRRYNKVKFYFLRLQIKFT